MESNLKQLNSHWKEFIRVLKEIQLKERRRVALPAVNISCLILPLNAHLLHIHISA